MQAGVVRRCAHRVTMKMWRRFTHERETAFDRSDVATARKGLEAMADETAARALQRQYARRGGARRGDGGRWQGIGRRRRGSAGHDNDIRAAIASRQCRDLCAFGRGMRVALSSRMSTRTFVIAFTLVALLFSTAA